MNMQMIKVGTIVIVVAVVGYIFMPGKASSGKAQLKAQQTASASSTTSAKHKTQTHKSKKKTLRQEARIEPDTTLRKETNIDRRSGPPSKMYGGL